jgi:hypothetical protein
MKWTWSKIGGIGNVAPAPFKLNCEFWSGSSGTDSAFALSVGTIATRVTINNIDVIFVLIEKTSFTIYLQITIIDYVKTISYCLLYRN